MATSGYLWPDLFHGGSLGRNSQHTISITWCEINASIASQHTLAMILVMAGELRTYQTDSTIAISGANAKHLLCICWSKIDVAVASQHASATISIAGAWQIWPYLFHN